jgi:hypothetical protein
VLPARLEPVAQVPPVDRVALVRPVAPVAQRVQAVPVAAQDSPVPVARQVPVAVQVLLVPVAAVALRAAAVAEPAQPVLLARAVAVARARLASRSERSAKSLSKEVHRAWVARLCHVATAAPAFACAAVQAFKTLPTRLTVTPVS